MPRSNKWGVRVSYQESPIPTMVALHKQSHKKWIKPDRPKTKKAKDPDQVRKKRWETLLPKKSPSQVMNILPPSFCWQLSIKDRTSNPGVHSCPLGSPALTSGEYTHFNKLFHLHHLHCVQSVLEFFLVTRLRDFGDIIGTSWVEGDQGVRGGSPLCTW